MNQSLNKKQNKTELTSKTLESVESRDLGALVG